MSRIRTNLITNRMANGAPTVSNGLVISGVTTSTSFSGDGSALTGITQTTINNNGSNRIITGSGTANTLEGEATFTYDGVNKAKIDTSQTYAYLQLDGNSGGSIEFYANGSRKFELYGIDAGIEIYDRDKGAYHSKFLSGGDLEVSDGKVHVKGSGELLRLQTNASGGGQCYIDFDDETATRASIGMRGSSSDTLTLAALNGSMRFDVQNKTQALNITSNGQLLIGTTTAVRALTIKDPGQIHVESTDTGNWVGMSIKGSSGTNNYNAYFGVLDSNGKFFIDNSSNGADIEIESGASGQKAGRVLVGPSVPTSGDDSQMIIRNNPSNGIYRCLRLNNDSNNNRITMTFEGNGTATGDIRLNGSTTSYNSYSDYRLKENVVPLTDPVTRLKTLKPYRFNFIASPDITLDGFFAHEVSPAVAEAVGGEKDDVDNDGNVIPQALDMAKLVPLLTASLQEAFTKIEALEAEVAVLKSS